MIGTPWISKLSEHPSADILRNFILLFRFIAKSMVNSKNAHNNDPYLIQIQCQYFTNGFFPTVFSHCFVLLFLPCCYFGYYCSLPLRLLCVFLPFIWAMCLEFKWPLNVKLLSPTSTIEHQKIMLFCWKQQQKAYMGEHHSIIAMKPRKNWRRASRIRKTPTRMIVVWADDSQW